MNPAKISLSVMTLSLLTAVAHSQYIKGQRVRMTPEDSARAEVEWMKDDLKLKEATLNKVYDIVLKYAKQSADERQKLIPEGNRDLAWAKATEIMAARDKELKSLLGERTFKRFKNIENERKLAMQERQN